MIRRLVGFVFVLAVLGSAAIGAFVYVMVTSPVVVSPEVIVEVKRGAGSRAIANELAAKGVVRDANILLALARFRELDKQFHFGEHRFSGSLTPDDVLQELATPPTPTIRVTIPEGLTFEDIADLLVNEEILESTEEYIRAACDPAFLKLARAHPDANCAEGYLYPDTYELAPEMSARDIVRLQFARFRKVVEPLLHAPKPDADSTYTHLQLRNRILTMASIIEKETRVPAERPLVSAVIHNRIRFGMRIQMDPTVIYGIRVSDRHWNGNITRQDLREPTPYNTYTIDELPPGPICNPGVSSVRAALEPANSDFLYFVATGDGGHKFSKSLAEHNRAVRKYQLN